MGKQIEFIAPVKGAASYRAYGNDVYMTDDSGHESVVDSKRNPEAAIKAAIKWQKKENAIVTKNQKNEKLKN